MLFNQEVKWMRLHSIKDPDGRMVNKVKVDGKEVKVSRIEGLNQMKIGYLNITNFKQDGVAAETKTVSSWLILPNSKTILYLRF
jgi:hypothetical protein